MKLTMLFLLFFSLTASAQGISEKEDGVYINDQTFPWHTIMHEGKVLGCIYESRFYSLGSILILESLPRKCELASDRNGIWKQLSESEMILFKENIEAQQTIEREATYIGAEPISPIEARVIRYLRNSKKFADRNQKTN